MEAGAAMIDITPPAGCELSGYVARVQPSLGIQDPLSVRALYLEAGVERFLLWLHADLIGFERAFVRELKKTLGERAGLDTDDIVISATHTHSGPPTLHLINLGAYDEAYMGWLRGRMLEAAAAAMAETETCEPVMAEGVCELAIDRRGQASAHTDHRVGVVGWRRPDGAYKAVLANYAMHNVGWRASNRKVSGDILGRAALSVRERLRGQPVVLFTNGACGNTNPAQRAEEAGDIEAMGGELAGSVTDALASCRSAGDSLSAVSRTLRVPLATVDADGIRAIAARTRAGLNGQTGYVPDRVRDSANTWEAMMVARAERGDPLTHAEIDIHAVRIGAVKLVCLGAEVFSVMADQLRAAVGERTYVVGYANGEMGYLPTAAAYAEGGYEVESAFIYYGAFAPQIGAFESVRDEAIELASQVCQGL
ncbi:MAG: hypothetical protein GWP08_17070 [Nitrospiraceae bacterium]|nr:hypothetical protein [Nitrospiraceae bacterium]